MESPRRDWSMSGPLRAYRRRILARGRRLIHSWVAGVRATGFAAEAHRQSAAVAASDHAADDQAIIDALSLDDE